MCQLSNLSATHNNHPHGTTSSKAKTTNSMRDSNMTNGIKMERGEGSVS